MVIRDMIDKSVEIVHLPKTQDDPTRRRPNITRARQELQWSPKWKVDDGLKRTISYFIEELKRTGEVAPVGPPE